MSARAPIFECVPNVAEGREISTLAACADAIVDAGATLAHQTSDVTHHRSVFTFFGTREIVLDAALALARVVAERVDLRMHRGVHPRIGALDVLPFVPVRDATLEDAADVAHEAAARLWRELQIPSYFYDAASPHRPPRTLPQVRRGEFEGLVKRKAPTELPDVGDVLTHPTAGATAIGARDVLIAFNVELASGDVRLAESIARRIRERNGGLRTLRALGLHVAPDRVQVSCNVTDTSAIALDTIVELVRRQAARHGIVVTGSELIGLVPRAALQHVLAHRLRSNAPSP